MKLSTVLKVLSLPSLVVVPNKSHTSASQAQNPLFKESLPEKKPVSEPDYGSYDKLQKASLNIESTTVDPFGSLSRVRFYTDTFEERDTVSNLRTSPNGDRLEGTFKGVKLGGDGVVIIKAGVTYKGLFEKGIFVCGVLTLPDGETREGTFKDG